MVYVYILKVMSGWLDQSDSPFLGHLIEYAKIKKKILIINIRHL